MGATLVAKNLRKSYRRRQVVADVSFEVQPGEIVGLLGPNGAGKTTSFNIVAGLLRGDAGSVTLGPHELARLPLWRRARLGLGYLPQEATVFRGLSARENLLAVLEAQPTQRWSKAATRRDHADAVLAQYNLLHVADSLGAALSGGERRRLEMARALLPDPQVLLLDEPFAGVDPIAVAEIRIFIQRVRDRGIGVLLTDHNVRETLGICSRAYLIAEGRIVLAGTPEEMVQNAAARRNYLGEDFKL
jgi:lipopolysaccharide export system ATP-binding protein